MEKAVPFEGFCLLSIKYLLSEEELTFQDLGLGGEVPIDGQNR
jgi:hypothetical protein